MLKLNNNEQISIKNEIIYNLQNLKIKNPFNLIILRLDNIYINTLNIEFFKPLNNLKELLIHNTNINNLQELKNLGFLNLRILDFRSNKFDKKIIKNIKFLFNFLTIKEYNLNFDSIKNNFLSYYVQSINGNSTNNINKNQYFLDKFPKKLTFKIIPERKLGLFRHLQILNGIEINLNYFLECYQINNFEQLKNNLKLEKISIDNKYLKVLKKLNLKNSKNFEITINEQFKEKLIQNNQYSQTITKKINANKSNKWLRNHNKNINKILENNVNLTKISSNFKNNTFRNIKKNKINYIIKNNNFKFFDKILKNKSKSISSESNNKIDFDRSSIESLKENLKNTSSFLRNSYIIEDPVKNIKVEVKKEKQISNKAIQIKSKIRKTLKTKRLNNQIDSVKATTENLINKKYHKKEEFFIDYDVINKVADDKFKNKINIDETYDCFLDYNKIKDIDPKLLNLNTDRPIFTYNLQNKKNKLPKKKLKKPDNDILNYDDMFSKYKSINKNKSNSNRSFKLHATLKLLSQKIKKHISGKGSILKLHKNKENCFIKNIVNLEKKKFKKLNFKINDRDINYFEKKLKDNNIWKLDLKSNKNKFTNLKDLNTSIKKDINKFVHFNHNSKNIN